MKTLFQISNLAESAARSPPARSRSPSSGRTGRFRPSARSCRRRRARGSDRPARTSARCRTPRRRAGIPFSPLKTETTSRSAGSFHTSVSSFQANRIAVGLEVVAEREVAEHLEERVVAQRRPDVVEVVVLAADAHALLRGRGARVVALLPAEEHVLELVHPGIREQQRRDRRPARAASWGRCGGRAARSTRGRTRESRSKSSCSILRTVAGSAHGPRIRGLLQRPRRGSNPCPIRYR